MSRNLYIIGAGGFGRELEGYLDLIPKNERDWELKGYLDSVLPLGNLPYPSDYKVIDNEKNFNYSVNDLVLISIADPNARENIFNSLKNRVTFFTYISPKSYIGKFCKIGEGSIISPNVHIATNTQIGESVIINVGSQIGHDSKIGNFSSIMSNVNIGGGCSIGEKSYLGTSSVVIPRKKIGDKVTIGAGSVVIRNIIKEGVTVFGNPATLLV